MKMKLISIYFNTQSFKIIIIQSLVLLLLFTSFSTSFYSMKRQIIENDEPNYIDLKIIKDDIDINLLEVINSAIDNNVYRTVIVLDSRVDNIEYQYFYIANEKLRISKNSVYNLKSNEAISSSVIYKDSILKRNEIVEINNEKVKVKSINYYANISESDNTLTLKYNNQVVDNKDCKFIRLYIDNKMDVDNFFSYVEKLSKNSDFEINNLSHYVNFLSMYLNEGDYNSYIIILLLVMVLTYIYLYIINLRKRNIAILEILGLTKINANILCLTEILIIIISTLLISMSLYTFFSIFFAETSFFSLNIMDIYKFGGHKMITLFIVLEVVLFYLCNAVENKGNISVRYKGE